MRRVWFLTQFYDCQVHGWQWPVCTAYGANHHAPLHPPSNDGWALVWIWTTHQQIQASKRDPRVIYCGAMASRPPAKVLEVYKDWLDPAETYTRMDQLLELLAEHEPNFLNEGALTAL